MREGNYWTRLRTQKLSRRRLLAGAVAAGAGAAGLAAVGCGGGEEGGGGAGGATPTAVVGGQPTLTSAAVRGGTYRGFNYDSLVLDTRDPHQTRLGPMYNTQSYIFSKVLNYFDETQQIIWPDLSSDADGNPAMPEQVDDLTYVIRVRPTARFHDTPQIQQDWPETAGRPVTAEDIKFSIERQVNPQSPKRALYYRRHQWETVDKIEVVDDHTLRITTKKPCSPFIHFLADRNSFIIPRELVDPSTDDMNADNKMVGSGPFILDELKALQKLRVVRNPNWFAADDNPENMGTRRPFLDAVEISYPPESDSVVETAFKTKQVDAAGFTDQGNLYRVMEEVAGVELGEIGTSGGLASALLIDRPPFNDVRVRKAVNQAQDRHALGEQMYPAAAGHPRVLLSGTICWPVVRWAIPQDKLATYPGYRFGPGERDADIADARQLFEAAGGRDGVGPINILFSTIPPTISQKVLPQVVRQLEQNLGAEIQTAVDQTGYTEIIACLSRAIAGAPAEGCVFTWSFDNGFTDLDDWLYSYFHTGGGLNSYPLSDELVDQWLDDQRAEFDYEKRREIGWKIQDRLQAEIVPGYRYFNDIGRSLRRPYTKNARNWPWFGPAYWFANVWLDSTHADFSGRPS
jgi:peptide/nickel transport system substrate-binding protein